jgi:toxin secretion/phage lysis holin
MDILGFLQAVINLTEVKVLVALLMANFFSGLLSAAVTGTFDFGKLKDIWKRVGAIFGAYLVFSVVSYYVNEWSMIRVVAYASLIADLTQKILKNLKEMGLPVPDQLTQFPVLKQTVGAVGLGAGLVAGLPGRLVKK